MQMTKLRPGDIALSVTLAILCATPGWSVTATRGPLKKQEKVLDEKGIFLENEYLKVGITTNQFAGQIMLLVYKPTGQDLCAEKHEQGYCTERMGEDRFFYKTKSEAYAGEIVSQSDDKAEARITYLWNYNYHDIQTRIRVTKTIRLAEHSSALEVTWGFRNLGEKEAPMTPWIKHLGGKYEKLLAGPSWVPFEDGARDPGGDFVPVTLNWSARLSGTQNTEEFPMVCSIVDFRTLLQQFPWRGRVRFTLETILNRIHLKPGKKWQTTYVLVAMPNLGNPLYAAPELAAAIQPEGDKPVAGEEAKATVHLSPALEMGEKRLEGEVLTFDGEMVAKLPNRQVSLTPGKLCSVSYAFTPPRDGVYTFSLTVFDNQQIVKLGEVVNSQRPSITLPLVVGPKPAKVIKKWESSGVGWPCRKERTVTPWRTLARAEAVKCAQIRVPERVYPEDRIAYPKETQSASIRVARGEYEDLQFVVDFEKEEDVLELELSCTPLRNTRDQEIAGVKLYEAIYLTTDTPSGYKNFPVGEWPDPLFENGWLKKIPNAPITLKNIEVFRRARRRVFWLIVKVPRDASPGRYLSDVGLRLKEKLTAKFSVEVNVEQFALPKRPSYRPSTGLVGAGKFRTNFSTLGLPDDEVKRLERDKETGVSWIDRIWQKCLEYGWTPTMWSGPKMWRKYHDHGRGMTSFSGASKDGEEWLKEKGLLKYAFVYAPFDEHADVLVPKVAEWCREFRKKSDVPILDCYYGGNVKPLFGLVDVWLGQSPTQAWAKERKKAGDQFLSCNSSLIWHVEFEPVKGRAAFWQDFADGVDGRYVYSSVRWTPNVYKKNWTSGNYMGCAIYPGPSGLTTSIRWETMRDGVEDYDYLAILRAALARKRKEGGASQQLLDDAAELLDNPKVSALVGTVADLSEMRSRVANLITELSADAK